MTIPVTTGYLDPETNEYMPEDQGTWADIAALTWADWEAWTVNPADFMWWVSNPINFDAVQDFNLKIVAEANGIIDYYIYTSTTGEFDGEEVETEILNGAQDVAGFTGRSVIVAAKVNKTVGINKLTGINITATTLPISENLVDVNTSTLSGTVTARQLVLSRNYSKISDISVSCREITAYNLDLYVSNYATSTTLIPRVVSKSRTAPTIALLGIDGSNKDGIVDVVISGLPQQYMRVNNLLIR